MEGGRFLAVMTGAALAAAANAQLTATYSIHFGSPSGPSIISPEPGHTTSAFVVVSFSPGIGQPIGSPPGAVIGLFEGGFGIVGSGPGSGSWSEIALDAPYNFPLGTTGPTTPGASSELNVSGAHWCVGFWLGGTVHPSPNNPDVVWSGQITWNGDGVTTLQFTDLEPTGLLFGGPIPGLALYDSIGLPAMILPAPGAAALLGLAGLIAARRRRTDLKCTLSAGGTAWKADD